jgi:hypothetical protein
MRSWSIGAAIRAAAVAAESRSASGGIMAMPRRRAAALPGPRKSMPTAAPASRIAPYR